jgi:hypothetical protein
MSSTVQYRYLHKGDNEWLSDMPPVEIDDWNEAWGQITQNNKNAGFGDIKVEITEDMYVNSEYGETPEWVNITIRDSGVLPFKMARSIIKSNAMDGLRDMCFTHHFDVEVSEDWGGWSYTRLQIYEGGASLTICAKHSSEELEISITEQFNQAIGEEA